MSVVVLTTYNRLALLNQCLKGLLPEIERLQLPLEIFDDWSTDERVWARLGEVVQEARFSRIPIRWRRPGGRCADAHQSTALNNLFAFRTALRMHPAAHTIVKVDDDAAIAAGGIGRLIETFDTVVRQDPKAMWLSGVLTKNDFPKPEDDARGYGPNGGCHVVIAYRAEDVRAWLEDIDEEECAKRGFDWHFMKFQKAWGRDQAYCLQPSIGYHCGRYSGVHAEGDLNYEPQWPGIFVE